MTWSRSSPPQIPNSKLRLDPLKVLYYFDGPQIFCARFGFLDAIFVKIEDNEDYLFLSTTTTDEIVNFVEYGKLSVRGAFLQQNCWLVETDINLDVKRYWPVTKDQLSEEMLPKPGVSLLLGASRVPDTVEQARSYFSIAFRGDEIASGKMPFGALKSLVEQAYEVTRKILMPTVLKGSRSATFDLIAEPTIGSLIISIDKPLMNIPRINKKLDEVITGEFLDWQMAEQRSQFFEAFAVIVNNPSSQSKNADDARDIVAQYRHVIPNDDSSHASIEFTANLGNEVKTIFIDTEAGKNIHKFFDVNNSERATRSGKIVEINLQSGTFLLVGRAGRIVTCVVPSEAFKDAKLRIGNHAEVSGQFYRRDRRDLMYVSTYIFSDPR